MAPKKSGGGGSSYSYGDGSGGGSDSGYTSPWLEKNRLPGSGWHDGILVTSVVFAGILMSGLSLHGTSQSRRGRREFD